VAAAQGQEPGQVAVPGPGPHAEEASETLWPERPPDAARNNLHQAVHAARRAIDSCGADGRACLQLREGLLLLSPGDPPWIDVVAFEQAAKTARMDGDVAAYEDALALCSGELLPEDRFEEWASTRRESLHQLRLARGVELGSCRPRRASERQRPRRSARRSPLIRCTSRPTER
jgi:DNA-binding SARP family transcriptional activator